MSIRVRCQDFRASKRPPVKILSVDQFTRLASRLSGLSERRILLMLLSNPRPHNDVNGTLVGHLSLPFSGKDANEVIFWLEGVMDRRKKDVC